MVLASAGKTWSSAEFTSLMAGKYAAYSLLTWCLGRYHVGDLDIRSSVLLPGCEAADSRPEGPHAFCQGRSDALARLTELG